VLQGIAPPALLDSYDAERGHAAHENLLNSTRSTDFITPKSAMSRVFRDAVLDLARDRPFAQRLVNSGRLSVPAVLRDSELNPPGSDPCTSVMELGAVAIDAPVMVGGVRGWFLRALAGQQFALVIFSDDIDTTAMNPDLPVSLKVLRVLPASASSKRPNDLIDVDGTLARTANASPGTCLLYRPDQHLAARWNGFDPKRVRAAIMHCIGWSN